MKQLNELKNDKRLKIIDSGVDGGACYIRLGHMRNALIVYSNGGGWDHVSVSFNKELPTWDDMCKVKNIFFNDDECVIQYHPPKSDYVNIHPYCLHLWKPQFKEIPMPPLMFV